jgi:CheY-like chemotaxis protein
MSKHKLRRVLLVDDYEADNFLHRMLLEATNCCEEIHVAWNGQEAIDFLTTRRDGEYPRPELICLDINMPIMNGWEFLDAYEGLPEEQRGGIVLMMITTTENPEDEARARNRDTVAEYARKPLTLDTLRQTLAAHFPTLFPS